MEKLDEVLFGFKEQYSVDVFKISDLVYKIAVTGGLFKGIDTIVEIEKEIEDKLSDEFEIITIYGDGLDVIFSFTKKE